MILNLNGISLLLESRLERRALINLYFDKTTSAPQPRKFWLRIRKSYIIDFLRLYTTQMFQNPCMIVVTIAATRMYRSLVNFDSSKM